MAYICGVPRAQAMLLPEYVEDFIGPENPVRVIDAFVEQLDLAKLGFPLLDEGLPGARSYDPKVFLKLFIYGYLHRVRSSRELERATRCNLEVIWLLRRLTPDHWTINDFRREHRTRFKELFREFNLLCGKLELFSKELIAIDGTFLKGVNHPARNFTKAKLEKLLKEIDERTEQYLATLETGDQEAERQGQGAAGAKPGKGKKGAPAKPLRDQLAQLEQERQKYAELLEQLRAEPGQQISLTDPESRLLHKGSQNVVGYNAQIAVEGEHHFIVAQEVTRDPNDTQQLAPMAEAACAALGAEALTALGDGGYYNLEQLQRCEAQGIVTHVPAPQPARVAGDGTYPDTSFLYDAEADAFHCPQGQQLPRHKDTQKAGGGGTRKVYYNTKACRECPVREACTQGEFRRITVHEHAATAEAVRERMEQKPEVFARRKGLVEHCFGTLKFWMGHAAFLTRGLAMVRAEFSLSCLGYNLRRLLNLVSVPTLLAALRGEVVPKMAVQGA